MRDLIAKLLLNSASLIYPVFFMFNYYVVTFTHMKNIAEDKTYLIVFFFTNVLSFYIICVYCKLYQDSGKSRIHLKYRNLENILESSGAPDAFNEAFLRETLVERDKKVKICIKCNVYKPPRAHHCSICNCCYLKMDHHCTVLNICIGHKNYKAFYLFLLSNTIFGLGDTIIFFIELFYENGSTIPNAFYIVGLVFGFCISGICGMMLVFHTSLLMRNETTIEYLAIKSLLEGEYLQERFQEGPMSQDRIPVNKTRTHLNPYNLGYKENFFQVFGREWYVWALPYFSGLSKGFNFPKNYIS